jgi:hypothetical protein
MPKPYIKSFLPVEAEITVTKVFITANMKNSAYTENEFYLWGTSLTPVSFPIFVVSSSCKRVSGR